MTRFICIKPYTVEREAYPNLGISHCIYTYEEGEIYQDSIIESFTDISHLFWIEHSKENGCRFSKFDKVGNCVNYRDYFKLLDNKQLRKLKLQKIKNALC